jgi:hypothetical protein
MTTLTLNIGLNTNDGTPAHESITVLQYLTDNGFFVRNSETRESNTEQTLVVYCDTVHASRIYAASIALKQDCIAVSPDGGITGALIGPRADKWGWTFLPVFFLP